jgi:hypothetical protein
MEKLAGRRRFGVDSKKINRLRRHDGNRDAGGKTARDRPRNEFDEVAHARKSHGNKKSSGHHRSQDQAGVAVFLDNQQNDRNEAAVGPPICMRLPPRLEITKPAKIAVNSPSAGGG